MKYEYEHSAELQKTKVLAAIQEFENSFNLRVADGCSTLSIGCEGSVITMDPTEGRIHSISSRATNLSARIEEILLPSPYMHSHIAKVKLVSDNFKYELYSAHLDKKL